MIQAAQTQVKASPMVKPSPLPTQSGLLQRKCTCGGTPGVDGEFEGCRSKRLSLQGQVTPITLQTKLTVNKPGDRYEQEADQVAAQIMRMPELEQASGVSGQTLQVTPELQTSINSMRGRGQPLPATTRAFMEPRFGHDFSQVRIHADAQAVKTAQAVNARAYTMGRDIVFGAEQYAPGTCEGKQLLAHELTHVIQQTGQHGSQIQRQEAKEAPQTEWIRQMNEILPHVGPLVSIDRVLLLLELFSETALSELIEKIHINKDARALLQEYGVSGIVALGDTLTAGGLDVASARKALNEVPKRYTRAALELRSRKTSEESAQQHFQLPPPTLQMPARQPFSLLGQRKLCKPGVFVTPLNDMSTFQSPGAAGWWGAKFGCYRNNCTRRHRGWDIHAPVGTTIYAVESGMMTHHENPGGWGHYIRLRSNAHANIEYVYGHLSEREPADRYCGDDRLGKTGTSGNASANRPHLHFEVQVNGIAVDPIAYFAEPNQVVEATGSAMTNINKSQAEPCHPCAI